MAILITRYSVLDAVKAFEKVMQNPKLFKDNQGIAHVFWLNHKTGKLRPDNSWHMNQRIESHGEFLNILADKIITSNYDENLVSNSIIRLTVYLMHYFAGFIIFVNYNFACKFSEGKLLMKINYGNYRQILC